MPNTDKSSKSPAVNKALEFLRSSVESGTWKPNDRLPSIDQLADMVRVSASSMWKAVAVAKRQSLVTAVRGGYITAGTHPIRLTGRDRSDAGIERGTLRRQKRVLLERDILNGRYHERRVLPPSKELQAIYGASRVTLRKILGELALTGLVVPYKRTYRVPFISPRRAYQSSIVWIAESASGERASVHRQRLQKLIDTLEYECSQSGMNIDFVDPATVRPGADLRTHAMLKDREPVIGYIVEMPWASNRDKALRLISELAIYRKPIGIIDSEGDLEFSGAVLSTGCLRVFRPASFTAGRQVGRFLLGLGHRHIAYISLLHTRNKWSVDRLAGVTHEYDLAGYPAGVMHFVAERVEGYDDHNLWFGDLDKRALDKIMHGGAFPDHTVYSQISADGSGTPAPARDKRIRSLQFNLAQLGTVADRMTDADMFASIRAAAFDVAAFKGNEVQMESLFRKALRNSRVTAWVGSNDGIALAARSFLERNKVGVPKDLSVVGFDNTTASFERKLTTYDFNMPGMMHRILWFIKRSTLRPKTPGVGPEEVQGTIIERDTTGRSPKRHSN